jgi:hypothetical protein
MSPDLAVILVTYYVLGMFADAFSTQMIISRGLGREGNRLPRRLFEHYGLSGGLALTELLDFSLVSGASLGIFILAGPILATIVFLGLCLLSGTMSFGAGIHNASIGIRNYRQWCKLRPVAAILRASGGQQRWIYEVNRPLPS